MHSYNSKWRTLYVKVLKDRAELIKAAGLKPRWYMCNACPRDLKISHIFNVRFDLEKSKIFFIHLIKNLFF